MKKVILGIGLLISGMIGISSIVIPYTIQYRTLFNYIKNYDSTLTVVFLLYFIIQSVVGIIISILGTFFEDKKK